MAWLSVDFESKALKMPVSADILLPQTGKNHKTIYLLHGAGGDRATWLLKTRLADYVHLKNVAVVMPSGNNSFYVNQKHGKDYMEYISQELLEICGNWFSLSDRKEDRMIAGMSMGGYGAFVNALANPDKFGYAAAFSGTLDIVYRYDHPGKYDLKKLFGSREELVESDNDLFNCVSRIAKEMEKSTDAANKYNNMKFLIMCGEQDPRFDMSKNLYAHMQANGLTAEFEHKTGDHNFDYWDDCIKYAVSWFMKGPEREVGTTDSEMEVDEDGCN